MNYIITADIKGFKYFLRTVYNGVRGWANGYEIEGLKNNATVFNSQDDADDFIDTIECEWELSIERV
jgi:hypothetical protein